MARFPALLPLALIAATGLIGPQRTVNAPAGDLLYSNPALAYSEQTGTWLSVVTVRKGAADPYEYSLLATVVDPDGGSTASTTLIGPGPISAGLAAIAWNPSRERHLVVASTRIDDINQVVGIVVGPTGLPVGGSTPFVISRETGNSSIKPKVASDGDSWMVVWTGIDPLQQEYGPSVRARSVDGASTNGAPVFGTDIVDVTPLESADYQHVDIAYGAGPYYFVVFQWGGLSNGSASAIGGCPLSRDGAPGAILAYHEGGDYAQRRAPAVAANPETGEFLLTWMQAGEPLWFGINARRVDANGEAVGEIVSFPVDYEGSTWDGVAAAWNPLAREYFLSWFESKNEYTDPRKLVAARLNALMEVVQADIVIANTTNQSTPERYPTIVTPLRAVAVASATADSRVLVQWLSYPTGVQRSVEAQLYDPVGLRAPKAPAPAQFRIDGTTSLPAGEEIAQPGFVARAAVESFDGSEVALEVQVAATGSPLGGVTGSFTSLPGESGRTVSIAVDFPGFAAGMAYHWRARTIDAFGAMSRWSYFGSSDVAEADIRIRATNVAPAMGALEQRRGSGHGAIAAGSRLSGEERLIFRAPSSDGDGDEVRIRVELRRVGDPYTGTATSVGAWTKGGHAEVEVAFPDVVVGDAWRWRAQLVDSLGGASDWVEFGGNDSEAADFEFQAWGSANSVARCGGLAGAAGSLWAVVLLLLFRARS